MQDEADDRAEGAEPLLSRDPNALGYKAVTIGLSVGFGWTAASIYVDYDNGDPVGWMWLQTGIWLLGLVAILAFRSRLARRWANRPPAR